MFLLFVLFILADFLLDLLLLVMFVVVLLGLFVRLLLRFVFFLLLFLGFALLLLLKELLESFGRLVIGKINMRSNKLLVKPISIEMLIFRL